MLSCEATAPQRKKKSLNIILISSNIVMTSIGLGGIKHQI